MEVKKNVRTKNPSTLPTPIHTLEKNMDGSYL